ncbi:MAG TPA: hypothetical protein DCS17_09950 [Flavobacterium sp.]|nr:hypothetical protein [Flavobacterium sp.]
MELDQEITFTTDEGYEYLIRFTEFPQDNFEYNIHIMDVSLILMSDGVEKNSTKTLLFFSKCINEYLLKNDVILYYYCDTAEIQMRSNRNKKMLPQEFRSKLFSAMFDQKNFEYYILKAIKVSDPTNGDHYVSLISHIKNTRTIEQIEQDILKYNK